MIKMNNMIDKKQTTFEKIGDMLSQIGKAFVPKRFRPDLRTYLLKAGIPEVPYQFFGILFYVAILAAWITWSVTNFYSIIENLSIGLVGLLAFLFWVIAMFIFVIIIIAGFYFSTNMKIYQRIKVIEDNLPDYLVLVSTNLKGGLSFEKSLWSSIKPEFGILSEEVSIVSKRVMTGTDLTDALLELSQKYDSPSLRRTLNIIIGEIESGGEVAKVLDQIIENLRKTRNIKDEMAANTLMFTIFIGVIVVFISPLLFALALNLLKILVNVSAQVAPALKSSAMGGGGFTMKEISIDVDEFKGFSVLAISIISIFSSMILSIIQKGDIRGGIKYVPFFLATAIFFYFMFITVLGGLFNFF